MSELARFQDAFCAALYADTGFTPAGQSAFRVYRNTVLRGCIDALLANFPTVERLVGNEWLQAAAAEFARRHPPTARNLLVYGAGFSDFLASFAPAQALPYLAGVARLDYYWLQAHTAADEAALGTQDLTGLAPRQLESLRLRPHATARWCWFADVPVYTIWDATRRQQPVPEPLSWRGQGALLLRQDAAVTWMELDETGCGYLDSCRAGLTLTELFAATAADAGTNAGAFMSLLEAGAFAKDSAPRGR